eukprot:3903150-Rhodomonas_salina.1
MDYPFMDPTCIITPGTLTADQINEMHATDLRLKLGELMEKEDDVLSAAPTQPVNDTTSEVGGAD